MTLDEQRKVRELTDELFPVPTPVGVVAAAKRRETQWRVYHALVKVGLL